jgi:AraC-like DNA-binding protein
VTQELKQAMEKRLKLLRVDLQIADAQGEHIDELANNFELIECGRDSHLKELLVEPTYDAICFDFDHPDRASLKVAEDTKQRYPSLPMIVITVQHSEQLAVWAFRSGMIDYLVKPFPALELARCSSILHEINEAKADQDHRAIRRPDLSLPKTAFHAFSDPEYNLQTSLYYVEQNFDKKIRVAVVAKLCNLSAFRFSRLFKSTYGITFRDYVVRFRLREACRLLQSGHATVTQVAYAVGFNDVSYFSRMFKRNFSVNPSDWMADKSAYVRLEALAMTFDLPLH